MEKEELLKSRDAPGSLKNKMCLKYLFLKWFSRKEVLSQSQLQEDEEKMQ